MKREKVFLIEMSGDGLSGPQIVGIATSEQKKDRMLAMLRDAAGEEPGIKFETYPFVVDCLIINDQPALF